MEKISIFSGNKAISSVLISESFQDLRQSLKSYPHVFVVMDENFAAVCPYIAELKGIFKSAAAEIMHFKAEESGKTFESVLEICSWMLEKGADRDALLFAVGGGVTTDMAGFAASIYKRGIRFAYMPTTLLSQIDAAIGGKTGVNFKSYKNILGTIRQPAFTYVCPKVLESLPKDDFLCGAAEMLKTFVIEDGGNYERASELFFDMSGEYGIETLMNGRDEREVWAEVLGKRRGELVRLISGAVKVKAGVVSRDQFEKGERKKLNLGHTFAHAIETLSKRDGSNIPHGRAVAMGLVLAARLADRYFRNDRSEISPLEAKISTDLWDADIPCFCPYALEEMADVMKTDKKAEGGKLCFVLPKGVGEVEIVPLKIEDVVELMKEI